MDISKDLIYYYEVTLADNFIEYYYGTPNCIKNKFKLQDYELYELIQMGEFEKCFFSNFYTGPTKFTEANLKIINQFFLL
jgi:hypothetical protein